MSAKKQYIDGDYLITEYESGAIIKVLQGDEPSEVITELPKNPILELKEENAKLKEIADKLILDNLNMQMQIDTLITTNLI